MRSSNPLIPDETVVHLKQGEWNGLCSLLRAYADGEPERATAGTDLEPVADAESSEQALEEVLQWIDGRDDA